MPKLYRSTFICECGRDGECDDRDNGVSIPEGWSNQMVIDEYNQLNHTFGYHGYGPLLCTTCGRPPADDDFFWTEVGKGKVWTAYKGTTEAPENSDAFMVP